MQLSYISLQNEKVCSIASLRRKSQDSITGKFVRDLWRQWHLGRHFSKTFSFSFKPSFSQLSQLLSSIPQLSTWNHKLKPYYWHTYLLTPRSRVLLENLTGFQRFKKFPAFYGTRRFITAFTSARHLSLSWASPTSYFLNIHLNIIFPSTPGSTKWSLSLRFPY